MKDKKKIVIGVLCALVAVMAVGYAALAQQLNITGTASIDSTWKVEITNISERDIVGDATSKEVPSYTATTANFSVGLIQPTDSITYDIEVSNLGTLAAKVDSIDVIMDENDAIIYTTEGIESGDKLGVDETDTLSVTVTYDPEVTTQPENTAKDISVTINYVQDIGGTDVVNPTPDVQDPTGSYNTYSVGDQITFAGSNWYVIKDSTSDEDYVTLMKEKALTSAELGEYASNYTRICTAEEAEYGDNGCTTEGQVIIEKRDAMLYYWSDMCHENGLYGYTEYDDSGCAGHNDYEGSKVKEYLDGTYINTLGTENLKEIEGYKIRLITTEELNTNLGWNSLDKEVTDSDNSNVPTWVYQNFGELSDYSNGLMGYWSMTPYDEFDNAQSIQISSYGCLGGTCAWYLPAMTGVRPVINLLKSSI